MSKETEEIIFLCIGAFLLLNVLGGGSNSSLALAKINGATNASYATSAASVINTALDDYSGDA